MAPAAAYASLRLPAAFKAANACMRPSLVFFAALTMLFALFNASTSGTLTVPPMAVLL